MANIKPALLFGREVSAITAVPEFSAETPETKPARVTRLETKGQAVSIVGNRAYADGLELEMKHKALRPAHSGAEKSCKHYVSLFDVAPVGKTSGITDGQIVETNPVGVEQSS